MEEGFNLKVDHAMVEAVQREIKIRNQTETEILQALLLIGETEKRVEEQLQKRVQLKRKWEEFDLEMKKLQESRADTEVQVKKLQVIVGEKEQRIRKLESEAKARDVEVERLTKALVTDRKETAGDGSGGSARGRRAGKEESPDGSSGEKSREREELAKEDGENFGLASGGEMRGSLAWLWGEGNGESWSTGKHGELSAF